MFQNFIHKEYLLNIRAAIRHYARRFQQAGEGLVGAFSLIMKTDESFAALVIMKTFIFN